MIANSRFWLERKIVYIGLFALSWTPLTVWSGDIWLHMLTPGANVSGTRYVGDTFNNGSTWNLQYEVGQTSWNASEAGIGPSNSDPNHSEWNWATAAYYADGSGNNRRVQRDIGSIRLTSSGTWYFAGRAKADSGDPWHYANNTTWGNSSTFSPSYSFTVTALNAPSSQTATRDATNPHTKIDLAWTRGNSGGDKNTIILRKTSTISTAPSQGSAYSVNDTIDGATVIYNNSGTSFEDTVSAGTTYYYAFYAENYSYYSTAVTASATTRPADATWDGGGSPNFNTLTEANWVGDLYPHPSSSTILRFAGSTGLSVTNTYAANSDFGSLYFNASSSSFTLSGNAFDLFSLIKNDDDSLQTVNNNITFGAGVTVDAEDGDLTVGGTLTSAGYRLTAIGQNEVTLSGAISGSGDVLKQETGTLTLSGNNSSLNPAGNSLYIDEGTVYLNHNNAGGASAKTIDVGKGVGGGSTWNASLYATGGVTIPNPINVNSENPGTMTLGSDSTSDDNSFTGQVTLEKTAKFEAGTGRTVTYSTGKITGSGGIDKIGAGTVSLASITSDFTGAVDVQAGTLLVNGDIDTASTLAVDAGATLKGDGNLPLTVINGTVDPGDGSSSTDIATLTAENVDLEAGGKLRVDISEISTLGSAGTDWDLIDVSSGDIENNVNAGTDFEIEIHDDNMSGNWDQNGNYSWVVIQGSSVTDFSAGDFTVDSSSWASPTVGSFAVEKVGNNLVVTYTGSVTYNWDAGGGSGNRSWSTASNWSSDTEPSATVEAFINGGYTGVVSAAGEVVGSLYVGNEDPGTGTLNVTGGGLTVSTNLVLGENTGDTGSILMTGGSILVSNTFYVGDSGQGTLTVSNASASVTVNGVMQVSDSDANTQGAVNQYSGTVTVEDLSLGRLSGTEGTYTLEGGELIVNDIVALADGNGNSTGIMELSNAAKMTSSDDLIVGKDGTGIFRMYNQSTVTVSGTTSHLILGDDTGNANNNRFEMYDSSEMNVGGDVYLGDAANTYGSMVISGGTFSASGDLYIGDDADSTGTVTVAGGDIAMAGDDSIIGNAGTGTLTVNSGNVTNDKILIGSVAGSSGILDINGGRVEVLGTDFTVGVSGSGTLTVDGGTLFVGDGTGTTPFTVSELSGSQGSVIQTAGDVIITNGSDLILGPVSGTDGQYTISGGTLDIKTGTAADLNIFFGTLSLIGDAWTIEIDDDFTMNNGSSELAVEFSSSAMGTIQVDDDIVIDGTLTITNSGAVNVGTYTVVTSVNASAVSGTFDSTNWLGSFTGIVSYANGAVTIEVPLEDPATGTATVDGEEAVDLAWTQNGLSSDVLIVRYASASPTETEPSGSLSVGNAVGTGTVIYKGSATSFKDTDRSAATDYTYFFYSVSASGTVYSDGISDGAATDGFATGEIKDSFSYGLADSLDAESGGTGFSANNWSEDGSGATFTVVTDSFADFTDTEGFGKQSGHRVSVTPGNAATEYAERAFTSIDYKRVYVAALMRYEFGENPDNSDGKFVGISFMDGSSEEILFGETDNAGGTLGVEVFGNGSNASGSTFANGVDRLVIGMYDFDTKEAKVMAYAPGGSIPVTEPGSWDAATTLNTGLTKIDGIRLTAGATSGNPGETFFDEVRVAKSWGDLIGNLPPRITAYDVDTDEEITDNQLAVGTWTLSVTLESDGNIDTDGTPFNPNFDLVNSNGTEVVTDDIFGSLNTTDPTAVIATDTDHSVSYANVVLGTHTVQVSAASGEGGQMLDENYQRDDGTVLTFNVVDDDTDVPIRGDAAGMIDGVDRSLVISLGGTPLTRGAGTAADDARYETTDGDLVGVSAGNPLRLSFSAYDTGSGLSRGTSSAASEMNIDIGSWVTDNVANYESTESTAFGDTDLTTATSVWKWTSLSTADITNLFTGGSAEHTVQASVLDADNDRVNDRELFINDQYGFLRVTDDDENAPTDTDIHSPDLAVNRRLHVLLGGSNLSASGAGTNVEYAVTDGQLAGVAGGNLLQFYVGALDSGSGLSRGTTDNATQSNIDIGDTVENNVAQYDASASSADSTIHATNVWTFSSAWNATQINDLFTDGTNAVRVSWFDNDMDRGAMDQSILVDQQHGYLAVSDDDTAVPTHSGLSVNSGSNVTDAQIKAGGYSISMNIQDADSGINVNGTTISGTDFSPNYDILNDNGDEIVVDNLFATGPADGGATSSTATSDSAPAAGTDVGASSSIDLGDYTVRISMTDNDTDRGEVDRETLTNAIAGTFTVVDDDTDAPTITSVTFGSSVDEALPLTITADLNDATSAVDETNVTLYYGYSGPSYNASSVTPTSGSGNGTYTFTLPAQIGQGGNTLKFSIVAYDNDNDRTGDSLGTTDDNSSAYYSVTINDTAVIYEPFTGTAGATLAGSSGTGWTNDWAASSTETYQSGNFSRALGAPAIAGGEARIDTTVNDSDHYAQRYFDAFTTGTVYVAWYMRYDHNGDKKYAGVSFMDGSTEVAFGGKINKSGYTDKLGLNNQVGTLASSKALQEGSGNKYFIVMKYDFDTQDLDINAYESDEIIAEEPDGYWNLSTNKTGVSQINGIRIASGTDDALNNIGFVYFDEIRVGTNWNQVVRTGGLEGDIPPGPTPELIYVGTNYTIGAATDTTITDSELADTNAPLDFAIRWTANTDEGMFITNNVAGQNTTNHIGSRDGRVLPNWDPLYQDGQDAKPLGQDEIFTDFVGTNGALVVTSYVSSAFNITNSTVNDTYYITVSGENNGSDGGPTTADPDTNGNAVPLTRGLTINSNLQFTVIDDDDVPPTIFEATASSIGLILDDDFTDGELDGWTEGTAGHWTNSASSPITGSYSLKHNLTGTTSESYITAPTSYSLENGTVTWRFQLKNGAWNPSSDNDFAFFLMADDADLSGSNVDGYAVEIDANDNDYVKLSRVTGGIFSLDVVASTVAWGSSSVMGIEVTRQTNGTWQLFIDSNGGFDNLVSAGSATDTQHTNTAYAGVFFDFTTTRGGELWVDDISIDQLGDLTDGDLVDGIPFSVEASDTYSGLFGTNETGATAPTSTILNATGTAVSGARLVTSGPLTGGGKTLSTFTQSLSLSGGDITIGHTYTARVAVTDYDIDRTGDSITQTQEFAFTVSDDDVLEPTVDSIAVNSGDDVTDAQIVAGGWAFTVTASDVGSGLSQGNGTSVGINPSANYRILNNADTEVVSSRLFDNAQSLSVTPAASVDLTEASVAAVVGTVDLGTYDIYASIADEDTDRGDVDRSLYDDTQAGSFTVVDDDTKGPAMVNVRAGTVTSLLSTGFEEGEGWPDDLAAGTGWTQSVNGATYSSGGAYVNDLDTLEGLNKAGFNDNGDHIVLPGVDSPGILTLYARLSSAGTQSLRVDYLNGASWSTLAAAQNITQTDYQQFSFDVSGVSGVTTMRLFAASASPQSIYIDNIDIFTEPAWTNLVNVDVTWEPSTDSSGIAHYEYVGFGAAEPSSIGGGTVTTGTSVTFNSVSEGVITGFVFAVDDDDDRGTIDREKGVNAKFIAKIDRTAPPTMAKPGAVEGSDPTTEIDLTWTAPADAGNASLSPWYSYRIYISNTGAVSSSDAYVDITDGITGLGVRTTEAVTMTNLAPGEVYQFALAGVDEAGNVGTLSPASDVIVLSGLEMTQGVAEVIGLVTNAAKLSWTATTDGSGNVNRQYDLIYVDSQNFNEATSNNWQLLQTITSNTFVDAGASPANLGSNMRFYRAAIKDRWKTSQGTRSASEQVYVLKNISLRAGQNWVSFPGVPDTNTVAYIFGTEDLPAATGGGTIGATKISWFTRTTTEVAETTVYLRNSGGSNFWQYSLGGSGFADNVEVPLEEAVVVELPSGSSDANVQFIGRVTTNTTVQTIPGNKALSLLSFNQPRTLHPSEMNLLAAGFTGGSFPIQSDMLWKYDRDSQAVPEVLWYDTDDSTWKMAKPGFPAVPAGYFNPDDGILIWTRASTGNLSWTNTLLYPVPTQNISP